MKRKLLFAIVALMCSVGSWAQTWTNGEAAADDGEYYLYNIGAHRFLNRGGTYTTHAIADGQGVVVKLDEKATNVYSIYTGVNSKYLNGDYTDGDEQNWTFTSVSVVGYTNVYTLQDGGESKYLYWVGGGDGHWGNEVLRSETITGGKENNFYWILIPKATRQNLASASVASPLDITYLVSNPDFEYQVRDTPWENHDVNSPNEGDPEVRPWYADNGKITGGWTNTNFWRMSTPQTFANGIFFEKYSAGGLTTADKIYQNVTLEAGKYRLTCTGIARDHDQFYLYAGDQETKITSAGTYTVDFTVTETSSVEIGAKIKEGGTGDWVAFDNVRLYCTSYVKEQIVAQKGDMTFLVNGTFQDNVDGWAGGSHITWVTARGWRGDNATKFYERSSTGALSYTLNNVPAGTYKVVAAARGYDGGTITPEIAGTTGTPLTCVGDARSEKSGSEINTNGVEMPYSNLGGFTADANGHNWKWITATGNLAADGDLVINFNCDGDQWMCIDDVHLYCTSLDATSYTRTVGDGGGTINTSGYVVTADIILDNPNTILRTTGKIRTAADQDMNNDQYRSDRITKLVLYDGYDYTQLTGEVGADNGAILYRRIPAETWCTLSVPFWPTATLTKKYPSSFSEGTVTFSDIDRESWGLNKPMLIQSASELTAIEGKIASPNAGGCGVNHAEAQTSGIGVIMNGTYSAISEVTYGDYVVARKDDADALYKVNSPVSLKPFRAYFSVDEGAGVKANILTLNFDDDATAIRSIDNEKLTINNGKIYNMAGQRVNKAQKGIYIVNGKKMVIK